MVYFISRIWKTFNARRKLAMLNCPISDILRF
uniref:Uncharacterized protein n=1 Tax=Arundo donax TaxID=35708 RepID=A0A0A9CRN7_ARUDO